MKKIKRILMVSLVVAGMVSCSSGDKFEAGEMESSESRVGLEFLEDLSGTVNGNNGTTPQGDVISSLAAVVLEGDTARRLIRTADLRFRVKDVAYATVRIEDIVRHAGGFVVRTNLMSHVSNVTMTPLSADSVLESAHFTVGSEIVVRVPASALDTTLRSLVAIIDFLDYRHINVRDVELELRANRLRQSRHKIAAAVPASGNVSSVSRPGAAGDQKLHHMQQADEAELANLTLEDQIRYSTVTIDIYQRPDIRRTVLVNEENIKAYKPSPGKRISESFVMGWDALVTVLEFFAKLWAFFLLGGLAWAGVVMFQRFYGRKGK